MKTVTNGASQPKPLQDLSREEARELGRSWGRNRFVQVLFVLSIGGIAWGLLGPGKPDIVTRAASLPGGEIAAADLVELFAANEAAAEKFGRRPGFAVRGTVRRVETGIWSPISIELAGTFGNTVVASADKGQNDAAAQLRPDTEVLLACGAGARRSLGQVRVDGCVIQPSAKK